MGHFRDFSKLFLFKSKLDFILGFGIRDISSKNYFGIFENIIQGYRIFGVIYYGILGTPLNKPHKSREQDRSPTRQLTDTDFEDSSQTRQFTDTDFGDSSHHPTKQASQVKGTRQFTDKTVHRHRFWRQFADKIEDSSATILKTVHQHYCFSD